MLRKIIKIDEEKCTGCGLCAAACHEGAIGMVDGKAKLLREDYCDGLGDCLPACPVDAISFEVREAAAYDEAAVLKAKQENRHTPAQKAPLPCGCPGMNSKRIERPNLQATPDDTSCTLTESMPSVSQLSQWPVQIKLVPVNAPYFDGAHLLIAQSGGGGGTGLGVLIVCVENGNATRLTQNTVMGVGRKDVTHVIGIKECGGGASAQQTADIGLACDGAAVIEAGSGAIVTQLSHQTANVGITGNVTGIIAVLYRIAHGITDQTARVLSACGNVTVIGALLHI